MGQEVGNHWKWCVCCGCGCCSENAKSKAMVLTHGMLVMPSNKLSCMIYSSFLHKFSLWFNSCAILVYAECGVCLLLDMLLLACLISIGWLFLPMSVKRDMNEPWAPDKVTFILYSLARTVSVISFFFTCSSCNKLRAGEYWSGQWSSCIKYVSWRL